MPCRILLGMYIQEWSWFQRTTSRTSGLGALGDQILAWKTHLWPLWHHGAGLPDSPAKLPPKPGWWLGMYSPSSAPDCRCQCISKAHLRPKWFQHESLLAKPNGAEAMDVSESFLTRSHHMCPTVPVRSLSRHHRRHHVWTPHQGLLQFFLVVRNL